LFFIVAAFSLFACKHAAVADPEFKWVLAESSYGASSWDGDWKCKVICDDGEIYNLDCRVGKDPIFYQEEGKINIKSRYVKKAWNKVSEKDFKEIFSLAEKVNSKTYESETGKRDTGGDGVSIYNPSSKERLTLIDYGAVYGKNTSPEAQELLKILGKYLKIPQISEFAKKRFKFFQEN